MYCMLKSIQYAVFIFFTTQHLVLWSFQVMTEPELWLYREFRESIFFLTIPVCAELLIYLRLKPMLLWLVHWWQKCCLLGSSKVINVYWFTFLSWLLINPPLINHSVMVLYMSLCAWCLYVGFFCYFFGALPLWFDFPCFRSSIHMKPCVNDCEIWRRSSLPIGLNC